MKNLIHVTKVLELRYNKKKLDKLKLETNNDTVFKRVKDYYLNGYLNNSKCKKIFSRFWYSKYIDCKQCTIW